MTFGATSLQAGHSNVAEFYLPNEHFLGLAKYAAGAEVVSRISLGGMGEVVIDPQRRIYTSFVPDWQVFCRAKASAFQVQPGQGASAAGHAPPRDVAELLWIAAFHLSDGRLAMGSSKYDVIRLLHWPNFSRLPSTVAAMEQALTSLPVGQITGIVETVEGLHIVRVDDKKPRQFRPFEQVKAEIQSLVFQQKTEDQYQLWMADLKNKAYIEIKF
jgi:hypothetical protein